MFVYGSYIDEPILLMSGIQSQLEGRKGIFAQSPTTELERYYYSRNQQFSITALTDENGNVVERYRYNAYGNTEILSPTGDDRGQSSVGNVFMYTGRYYHPELELYYFRARYYDPAIGRFIGRDPLEYVDGMSLYRGYFSISGIDPFGTICSAKKCGIESFEVTYKLRTAPTHEDQDPTKPINGTAFYTVNTKIKFKDDADHDPRLCQFRQFAWKESQFEVARGKKPDGSLDFRPMGPAVNRTWKDDNYTRCRDDIDGNKAMAHRGFRTTDSPGIGGRTGGIPNNWPIRYSLGLQQAVYDTSLNEWVAATPPIVVLLESRIVNGSFQRSYTVTPANKFQFNNNSTTVGTVRGVAGETVVGTYKNLPDGC